MLRGLVIALVFVASAWAEERPLLGRVSVGVVVGGMLTDASPQAAIYDPAGGSFTGAAFFSYPYDPLPLIVGPTAEVHLPRRLSVEFDALRRPMSPRYSFGLTGTPGVIGLAQPTTGSVVGVPVTLASATLHAESHTWEFPVLAKQRFEWRRLRPFVEAGPSWRQTGSYAGSSHVGVAAGGGVEFSWWRMRLEPTVRYTHWKSGDLSVEQLRENQAEVLGRVTF